MEGTGQGGGRLYSSYQAKNQFKLRSGLKAGVPTQRPSPPSRRGQWSNQGSADHSGFPLPDPPPTGLPVLETSEVMDKTQQRHEVFSWQFPSIQSWLALNKPLTKDLIPPMKETKT